MNANKYVVKFCYYTIKYSLLFIPYSIHYAEVNGAKFVQSVT